MSLASRGRCWILVLLKVNRGMTHPGGHDPCCGDGGEDVAHGPLSPQPQPLPPGDN